MWVFTREGFYSIVVDRDDPDRRLLVRARVAGDLEKLLRPILGKAPSITTTPAADYCFRSSQPRMVVEMALAKVTQEIGYENFKDACPKRRRVWLLRVWSAMVDMQDTLLPKRIRRRRARERLHGDEWIGEREEPQSLRDASFDNWLRNHVVQD